ncbi:single-stranded-DNA-specific exonuclease RecJ [Metallumcola ferriviriculae]|uniref:Single-stranded-DNA-specific exonuclease RecJ n=1 Tax=Metallumcola ferriviriculae TaxID=3039180 RepID=A0AAU0URQ1_9FIRM|nr:single-stranded-DNA-specific exonuclease RecJ [Desulfitibacteraceae bacterium MK1]
MQLRKRWKVADSCWEQQNLITERFDMSPLLAQVLINRGIVAIDDVEEFLYPSLDKLSDPLVIHDMNRAVDIILDALNRSEKVLVYGDYDVDGITGTALLVSFFSSVGIDVDYYIPDRMEEGYGLNNASVQWAKERGFGLIVTVDCGISAVVEADTAKELGIDLVITDHHQPPKQLPRAAAVVNPKLGANENCRDLAGVGVAFYLARALAREYHSRGGAALDIETLLDLVTLGTVADMVPLLGDNRIITKFGLEQLPYSTRSGMQSLMEVAGLAGKEINSGHVGFGLAPRLNAIGRLGNASLGVELLTTEIPLRADELAQLLDHENGERQAIEKHIFEEVMQQIEEQVDLDRERVIVLASPLWHSGVVGIVASRVVEKFYRPTVLIALEGETGKASARSIKGFDIYQALEECSEFLEGFGGHAAAAGFSITMDNIDGFRQALNRLACQRLKEEELQPALRLDGEVTLKQINHGLVEQLELLKPHGFGNPGPVFCCRGVGLADWKQVGADKKHAKMTFVSGSMRLSAIGFNIQADKFADSPQVDVAFLPEKNYWRGTVSLQLQVKDVRKSDAADEYGQYFGDTFNRLRQDIFEYVDLHSAGVFAVDTAIAGWMAMITAARLAQKQPVTVVAPLASQCRQLYNAVQLFDPDIDPVLVDGTVPNWQGSTADHGKVVLMTEEAFKHYRQVLPGNSATVLLNLAEKDTIETGEHNCFIIDSEDVFEHHSLQLKGFDVLKPFPEEAALTDMFQDGRRGIVFTALPSEADKVADNLNSRVAGEVMVYSERCSIAEKKQLLSGFSRGLYQVLVATHGLPLLYDFPINVILLDPPFNTGDLQRMLCYRGESNYCFTNRDWDRQQRLLEQLFLTRETLGLVYNTLKDLQNKSRQTKTDSIVRKVMAAKSLAPMLIRTALLVLSDLGLIAGGSASWQVLPVNEKKELEASWRYREGLKEFMAFNAVREDFINGCYKAKLK